MHRRSALKKIGLSSLSLPILGQAGSLFASNQAEKRAKQRLVIMFSPNGTIPKSFWPDRLGEDFDHKTILKPLEPFHDKMLILRNLHNKVRGDGDNHMRGMSCLLTGTELFPGSVMGGGNTLRDGPRGIPLTGKFANTFKPTNPPVPASEPYILGLGSKTRPILGPGCPMMDRINP